MFINIYTIYTNSYSLFGRIVLIALSVLYFAFIGVVIRTPMRDLSPAEEETMFK